MPRVESLAKRGASRTVLYGQRTSANKHPSVFRWKKETLPFMFACAWYATRSCPGGRAPKVGVHPIRCVGFFCGHVLMFARLHKLMMPGVTCAYHVEAAYW